MSTGYYQKNKERLQNLSEEEKNKKHKYKREWYENIFEDKRQRLVEYKKRYHIM